jgi:cytochrome b561
VIGSMAGRWPALIRFLHWTTAVLALVMIPAAFAAQALTEVDTDRAEMLVGLHMLAGLVILVLTLARLSARLVLPRRRLPRARLLAVLAGLRTAAFYALLLALPLTGVLKLTLSGLDVAPFGVTLIPAGDTAPALARQLNAAHAVMGKAFIALALVHIAAALVLYGWPDGSRARESSGDM